MNLVSIALFAIGCWTGPASAEPPQVALSRVEADISYAHGGDQQKLDLYLPEGEGFTTIIYVFGGGWHTGSRKSVTPIGTKLQSLGYGCALISHRLSPQHRFPAQIDDVAAAFAWVKKNIASKRGDPKRVFLMGHSSGAHLVLLLATDAKYLVKHQLSPKDIRGVVGLSSPVDLEPRKNGKGFGDALLAGRGAEVFCRDAALMKDASPLQHVTKDIPPILLVVGDGDFPMLEGDAKMFVEKAKMAGADARMFVSKERTHLGVVQHLLDEKDPVLEGVLSFIGNSRAERAGGW